MAFNFELEERVVSSKHGHGIVIMIDRDHDCYPIVVDFGECIVAYDINGQLPQDAIVPFIYDPVLKPGDTVLLHAPYGKYYLQSVFIVKCENIDTIEFETLSSTIEKSSIELLQRVTLGEKIAFK